MAVKHSFKIGAVVVVKPNVKDVDFGTDLGGWQGRVSDISGEDVIGLDWDSITLENMPASFITQCEQRGMGWDQYYIDATDVEPAAARDKLADVQRVIKRLAAEHAWDHLGEEGENISKILAGIDRDNEWQAMQAWHKHLSQALQFPFEAEVMEMQVRGSLRVGYKVVVDGIATVDDLLGIIVRVKRKHQVHLFPLCDLEATNTKSATHDSLQEYVVWFANR